MGCACGFWLCLGCQASALPALAVTIVRAEAAVVAVVAEVAVVAVAVTVPQGQCPVSSRDSPSHMALLPSISTVADNVVATQYSASRNGCRVCVCAGVCSGDREHTPREYTPREPREGGDSRGGRGGRGAPRGRGADRGAPRGAPRGTFVFITCACVACLCLCVCVWVSFVVVRADVLSLVLLVLEQAAVAASTSTTPPPSRRCKAAGTGGRC